MLVIHKRRTHTALELLCSEWHSVGQNLLSCFTILLNKFLGWEICYVFFPLFAFTGFPLYKGQSLTQYGGHTVNSFNIKILNSWGNKKTLTLTILWKFLIKSHKVITTLWNPWNKGLTVHYTIFPAVKDTFAYEWEITDVFSWWGNVPSMSSCSW